MATTSEHNPPLPTRQQIMDAFSRGIRTALLQHKHAGVPIVVWRDGKILQIPADEIAIPDLPDTSEDDYTDRNEV